MLWLIFIFLTCVAVLAVLLPLAIPTTKQGSPRPDLSLYRKTLSDIGQYLECGLVDTREASLMKTEAARRLLAKETDTHADQSASGLSRTVAAAGACLFVPILTVSLYLHVGRRDIPDHPLAERIALIPGHKDTSKRIEELERFIKKHPKDGSAYEMIAPFYQRARRFDDAVHALEESLRLMGADANRYASLGEAKVVAEQGDVPPQAIRDFEAALKLNPKDILARYYLGVAAAQSGDKEKAETIWVGLLSDAPQGADWAKQVEEDLRILRGSRRP
jgi:cytochrome c-type biogenesis protein CcmH